MASHQIKDTSIMHYIGNDGNGERYAVGYITPCRNDFIDVYDYFYKKKPTYNFNFGDMNQEDIRKRSKIYSIYLSQTEKFLQLIFQNGKLNNNIFNCSLDDEKIKIYTSSNNDDKYPFGTIISENGYIYSSDIILYLATFYNFNYKKMLTYIYDSISEDKTFPQEMEKDNTPWYIQQKNPISPIVIKYNFENIINLIKNENKNYNPCIIQYKNRDGIGIGYVLSYKNNSGDLVRIYYTFYHRHDSPFLNLVPIYPEPPYTLFNADKINDKIKKIVFLNSEIEVNNYRFVSDECIFSTCPLGLDNLPESSNNMLKNYQMIICWNKDTIDMKYIIRLKNTFKYNELSFVFYTEGENFLKNKIISYNELLSNDNLVKHESIEFNSKNGFADSYQKIPGSDRKQKELLSPVIFSGTINWLFSKEKLGKTWLALSIAYACAKGNRPVGEWKSSESCRVLYVDGEMPGNMFQEHCDMIMRGYNDNPGYQNRPFSVYSFFEDKGDYDSILDEEWLKVKLDMLLSYDLVIFDNYYSLNKNNIDCKPFLNVLRKLLLKNIAIIVVDHTNADDELQGSIIKRRASDLGIKLEGNGKDGIINIDYQFDRYCRTNLNSQRCIKFNFYDETFSIVNYDDHHNLDNTSNLNEDDEFLLYLYIALEQLHISPSKICEITDYGNNSISSFRNSVKKQLSSEDGAKEKIHNIDLFKQQLEMQKNKNIEEIEHRLKILSTFRRDKNKNKCKKNKRKNI